MEPRSGEITLAGYSNQEDTELYRKQYGYIPETPLLYEELNLYEHLKMTAMAYDIDEQTFQTRLPQLLKAFRLEKQDRKSTRLNSSHVANSYAVFCLKKKTNKKYDEKMKRRYEILWM